jgi:hypothetical protein
MSNSQDRVRAGSDFAYMLATAWPGASSYQVAKRLGNRVQRRRIWTWASGKEWPPQWAIDIAADACQRRIADCETAIARSEQIKATRPHLGNRANLKPFRQAA